MHRGAQLLWSAWNYCDGSVCNTGSTNAALGNSMAAASLSDTFAILTVSGITFSHVIAAPWSIMSLMQRALVCISEQHLDHR